VSNITEILLLLAAISNHKISPIYQSTLQLDAQAIPLGDPAANYFEPLLAHFNQLMKVYEVKEDENVIF